MLVWKGFGVLVPVVTFACLLAAELATETAFGDDRYYQDHPWPMAVGFAVAGILVGRIARRLQSPSHRVMLDEETGERVLITGEDHTFIFLPVRFWSPLLLVLGLLALLFPLTGT